MSDVPVDSVKSVPSQENAPASVEEAAATPEAKEPPDPVWGVGVGLIGLVTMATGGAATWHWVFNIGELIMLIGAAMFLGAVTSTSLRQRPLRLRERWAAWRALQTGAAD